MSSSSVIERSGRLWSTKSSVPTHSAEDQSDKSKQAPLQRSSNTDPFAETLEAADFMSILQACSMYNVPSIYLRNTKLTNPGLKHEPIVLGSGLTSKVVQFVITDDDPAKPRQVVALKTFTRTSSSRMARESVCQSIIREIHILCHPLLAGHPNIVKLHFIGWSKNEHFPALAIEHGEHGSLDHLMRTSWFGLTNTQLQQVRRHITIDIAVGLHAIHKANFIHGDLKPENIVVMSHPHETRRVVVKLADFGGSSLSPTHNGGRPVHYTPLWCAPEVVSGDPDVDWVRADVYSYGLIVSSLWASHQINGDFGAGRLDEPSSCFLANYLPSSISEEEEMDFFWVIKSEVDETSTNSLIYLLRNTLAAYVPDEIDKTQLLKALIPTLRAYYWLRPSTEDLCQSLQALALGVERNIREEMHPVFKNSTQNIDVQDLDFQELGDKPTSYDFSIIYEKCIVALEDKAVTNRDLVPQWDLPDDLPEDIDPEAYSQMIAEIIYRLLLGIYDGESESEQETRFADKQQRARLCWFIAMSSLISKSTNKQDIFSQMIYTAAMAGHNQAICSASLLFNRTDMETRFPIRCYLAALALSQSTHAAQILYDRWPNHYNVVQQTIKSKPLVFEKSKFKLVSTSDLFLLDILNPYGTEPALITPLSLRQILEMGLLQDTREVIEGGTTPKDFDETVAELLHGLSNLPDAEAAAMAPKAYQRGGKLSVLGVARSPIAAGSQFEDKQLLSKMLSPLSAAIRRGKSQLAHAIFSLHMEYVDEPIVDFDQALTLSCWYLQHDIAELLLNLYHNNPHLCLESQRIECGSEALLSELLLDLIVPGRSPSTELERRLLHGTGCPVAYKNTLEVLLDNGANPTVGFELCPLIRVLEFDDLIALQAIVESFERRNADAVFHLSDSWGLGELITGSHDLTALAECVHHGSIQSFEYITQRFPSLALVPATDNMNRAILHQACSKNDGTPFVEALLRCGVDVRARDRHDRTPLFYALLEGNLESADAILRYCTTEELEELIGRDSESGSSVFSALLTKWSRNRGLNMMEGFRWLSRNGGLHQFGPSGEPAWHSIVGQPRPFASVAQRLDVELLKLILCVDGLTSKASTEKWEGNAVMHYAASGGHVGVVKLLLDNGFDPNIRGDIPTEGLKYTLIEDGYKFAALDHVLVGLSGLNNPPEVERGGFIEVQKWFEDLEKIRGLLIENGGQSAINDLIQKTGYSDNPALTKTLIGVNMRTKFGSPVTGSWPKPFIEMPASTVSETIEQVLEKTSPYEIFRNLVRPNIETKIKETQRKHEKEIAPKNFMESIRSLAVFRKSHWRLPPNWRCLDMKEDASETSRYLALYVNPVSGDFTPERPMLKGEENIIEDDIYGATPLMRPEVLSSEIDIPALSLQSSNSSDCGSFTRQSSRVKPSCEQPQNADASQTASKSSGNFDCNVVTTKSGIYQFPRSFMRLKSEDGSTLLHLAVQLNNIQRLSQLLEADSSLVDSERYDGCTPLLAAVEMGNLDALALLLAYGADRNRITSKGYRPIHSAVVKEFPEVIDMLVQGGADVNATSVQGYTALHVCISMGDKTEMLEYLLEAGADVNAVGPQGSVLRMAVSSEREASVAMLLRAGAIADGHENLLHIVALGKSTKILEALLGQGLDVNKRDDELRTPVIVAATHRQFEVMQLLLEQGADASVFEEFQFFRHSYDDGESYSIAVRLCENRLTAEALNEAPDLLADVEDVRTGGRWEEWSILIIPNKEDASSGNK
ncbi:hypothetical protein F4803DRAFT_41297 [Xylaria telfairii]|nr:hypothetical protein F4803DRAFT_41297 [Xylaria telfairii]